MHSELFVGGSNVMNSYGLASKPLVYEQPQVYKQLRATLQVIVQYDKCIVHKNNKVFF